MKKYKTIGLSVLLAIFIASNFIVSFSFDKGTDSNININSLLNQAGADSEGGYGNNRYGACDICSLYPPEGDPVYGVYIHCWDQENSLCIDTDCTYGSC
jgi:hypothetical protein